MDGWSNQRMEAIYYHILMVLLIIAVSTNEALVCPYGCSCNGQSNNVFLDCKSLELYGLPHEFPDESYLIRMMHYPVDTIREGTFRNLTNLYQVNLVNNHFVRILEGAFEDLPKLYFLTLSRNNLTLIQGGAFKNLPALYSINLAANQLAALQQGTFDDLPALNNIRMEGNHITAIQQGTFKDLPSLDAIYLEGNRITELHQGTFKDLPLLSIILLVYNKITTIQEGAFENLPMLNSLILPNNKITTIHKGAFKNVTAMKLLVLTENHLTTIGPEMFEDLQSLDNVNLNGNKLIFVPYNTFANNINLDSLYLELFCDCNVPFWSWLKSKSFTSESVACLDRNNVQLSSLQVSDIDNCTNKACHDTDYCSNGGSCSQDIFGNLTCDCVVDWTGYTCIESANVCAENKDKFKTYWSKTAENTLTIITCTGNYTGNVTRYCRSGGKWEEPNYSNCISKSIHNIKEQTARLLSGDSEYNNVTIILEDLEHITRDNNELRSGDLGTSSIVLNDIAKYVTDHRDKLAANQLEIFGSLCDNLLDKRNHKLWDELNEQGSGGVSILVNAVTEFNTAFNDVIEDNVSLVVAKENVVMEVGKTSLNDITVPDRSKISESWISDSATEIRLKNICSGLTGYSSTFYRNISNLFPKHLIRNGHILSFNGSYGVNSIIADFSIHGTPCSNYSLIIKFDHISGNYFKPFCGHWNFSAPNTVNGAWSLFGSRVVEAADSYTTCEYNHTTNFAILMSPGETPMSHTYPLSLISVIGCGVSILFLVITIIVHSALWRYVRNDRTKILMNLCVALILSYVIFLAGITQTDNKVVCSAIAIALHYVFLTDFALMLAEGIHIFRMVVIIFPTRSIVHKLMTACWVVPAGVVAICASVTNFKGYGNHKFCWLALESKLIWAFIGPALLVILINIFIIIITVYKMMKTRGLAAKTIKVKSQTGLKSICVMLPLFGVTWVLGAFSLNDDLVMFQYLFAILNSLQGLFLCVFHCCLNEQVRQGYHQYQRRRQASCMDAKLSSESTKYDNPDTVHKLKYRRREDKDERI